MRKEIKDMYKISDALQSLLELVIEAWKREKWVTCLYMTQRYLQYSIKYWASTNIQSSR